MKPQILQIQQQLKLGSTNSSTQTTSISSDTSTNSSAKSNQNLELLSKSSILIDAKSGQVLYEHNAREITYPASTTKLMTAILTMENCQLTDIVTVAPEALQGIPSGYTTAALQAGEQLTVEQLLHVLLIPSANDAANTLACHIAGSIDNFAVMMNSKAKELGCENTHFMNPSGIHDDNHYSTAYDMALIGKYAATFDEINEITKQTSCELPNLPNGTARSFKTTNTLITPTSKYYYEYANGMKTGYTDKAKSCIVAKAKKDDVELICVVLGGEKTGVHQREADCHTLFDYGFNNYSYSTLCTKDQILDSSATTNIPEELQNSEIAYTEDLNVLTDSSDTLNQSITWNENLTLPIYKETTVGTITYQVDNTSYTVDLALKNDVLPENKKSISYIFYILVALLVILLITTIIRHKFKNRYHRKPRSSDDKYFRHSFY